MRATLSLCIYAILATAPRIPVAAQTPPQNDTPSRPAATKERAAPPADFSDLFAALAEEDMNWAATLARNFTREAPRALAIIAVARPAFDKAGTRRSH